VTVAAVIIAAPSESGLVAVEGVPRVRRLADAAWSGGALPIVVVADDPDGAVAAALAGTPVVLAEPAPAARGPAALMARGMEVATAHVHDTGGAIVWPVRMVWAGPETVTSLIEAHGLDRGALIRPTYRGEPGWPVLLPLSAAPLLMEVGADGGPDAAIAALLAAGLPERLLELGDPGTVLDASVDRGALPAYEGPPGPPDGTARDWGAAVADEADDAPLAGPPLARYPEAARDQGG
jgi:CTP:molybdopterin cytidylyltransferase MocA